jgi:YidC/Oxa1 family membrane protein insertase
MPNDNKNLITFVVMALMLLLTYEVYSYFVVEPAARQAAAHAKAAAPAVGPTAPASIAPRLSRPAALALSPRVIIDTPSLKGSIALNGARVDDLFLKGYHVDVAKTSALVELLSPEGMADAYFADLGWVGANLPGLPNSQTAWTLASGSVLAPGRPVVLTYAAPSGLNFTRTIAVDARSMFTITDTVANQGQAAVTLAPYASVERQGLPPDPNKSGLVHEGAIGVLGVDQPALQLTSYKSWKKKGEVDWPSKGGWLGITDKYWMTAFIPQQGEHIDAKIRAATNSATGVDLYEAAYLAGARTIAPGAQISEVNHLFAGAKTVPVLNDYKKSLGIPRFDDAVDWGILFFLTKPIFILLEFFHRFVGNFGVAILMLTVVIRLITFPLANKGFEMGVKMKKVQPELKALQAKFKDDPAAQQKEMMALYAREKVNPVTGCLPILFQIPVFYSLTKLFTVTIEMRHAPFFGWIHDLSARDPTTIMNLFGLIPWDPSMAPLIGGILGGVLHVGVWPLAYGLVTWLSQSMTPQTGIDPTQQMLFKLMPIMFTFILAQYAVGLLIYWTWSGLITILQQYVMMRRFKVDNPIDDFLGRFSAKPETPG